MTVTQSAIPPANIITRQDLSALIALAADLGAEFEVLTNEETGEEIGSIVRYDTKGNDDWSVSIMPDPYCTNGIGWVAVVDGEGVVVGPTVPEVVKCYRDWRGAQD